jgi:hypothetical protein
MKSLISLRDRRVGGSVYGASATAELERTLAVVLRTVEAAQARG